VRVAETDGNVPRITSTIGVPSRTPEPGDGLSVPHQGVHWEDAFPDW